MNSKCWLRTNVTKQQKHSEKIAISVLKIESNFSLNSFRKNYELINNITVTVLYIYVYKLYDFI